MNQREQDTARRLASLLDEGARAVKPEVAERLAAARRQALARHVGQPEVELQWAGAGGAHRGQAPRRPVLRHLVFAAVILVALAIGADWHASRSPDIADIDAALLTDELPINAFLDQSFDSWLKRGSR